MMSYPFDKPSGNYRVNALLALLTLLLSASAAAHDKRPDLLFKAIASFDVMHGNGSAVAEIIDVSADGRQLIYTDAVQGQIGFIDITNPARPKGQGTMDMQGEPTSLVIRGDLVLVAVNTSPSLTEPSGKLLVAHRTKRTILAELDLGGQPDSIALAPDQKRAAIVIENERDEDLDDGLIPQAPSGSLLIVKLNGHPRNWTTSVADLSPVAATAFAGTDLEPEFVDINEQNEAVVSFQENNHIAIVDLISGRTINHFSAGSVVLHNVDTEEEDLIELNSTIEKRREPDGVTWIDSDSFATANEGDYEDADGEEGGGRGFTIFHQNGTVEYESAESFEHLLTSIGHYNEGRSENKGVEPESVEFGKFGKRELLFVGSERSNLVGVYDVSRRTPKLVQVLPSGISPEGLKAIPRKGLLVASTETDEADVGIPTMVNVYQLRETKSRYPMLQSQTDEAGLPIPWVALSGLAADPWNARTLYAVSDAFLAEGYIYTLDVSSKPAVITSRLRVNGASTSVDLEGIAVGSDGYFWLASEGRVGTNPNAVLKVDPLTGNVLAELTLPAALAAGARNNGFEGIAVTGAPGREIVYVAIQRAWPAAGDTDKVNTKIGRYDVATGAWSFVHYPLEAEGQGDWIGLSELTLLPNGQFGVIERDKGWGPSTGFNAELKAVFSVDLADAEFRGFDDPRGLTSVRKTLLLDALPKMSRRSIWTAEKLEGFAVTPNGKTYLVTDNDGLDDATGETLFFSLGRIDSGNAPHVEDDEDKEEDNKESEHH